MTGGFVPEAFECVEVRRDCVVVEEAPDDATEPAPLFGDRSVATLAELLFDLVKL
jgi:hypothetical protein